MKKIIYCILIGFTLCSCSGTAIPLRTNYDSLKKVYFSDKSKDEVWNKIIQLFTTDGIGIKLIDKSSGLIVSEKTDFIKNFTQEDGSGKIANQNSFLVVSKYDAMGKNILPTSVVGSWNIRLFEENQRTALEVNLTNIEAFYGATGYQGTQIHIPFDAKSTGVFERQVAEYVR